MGSGGVSLVHDDVVERPAIAGHVAGEVEGVPAIGLARLERRHRAQPALQIERERRRSHGGRIGDARDRRISGTQDDAGLFVFALEHRQHRIARGGAGNRQTNIEPLRHRDREALPGDRHNLEPVDGDQLAVKLSQVDMKGAHRGAVDDAQQHAPAGLDLHHFGVAERAVVGQERVVFHVVQVGLGGTPSSCPRPSIRPCQPNHRIGVAGHGRHFAALFESREDFSGGVKLKSASMRTTSCWSGRSR